MDSFVEDFFYDEETRLLKQAYKIVDRKMRTTHTMAQITDLVMAQYMKLKAEATCKKQLDGDGYRHSIWNQYFSSEEVSFVIQERFESSIKTFEFGSGRGYMAYLHNKHREPKIMCVDPNPTSFCSGCVYEEPMFSTIDDVFSSMPKMRIEPVQLVFIWPSPEIGRRSDTFAEDALKQFNNVVRVIALYAQDGISGTYAFTRKLREDFDEEVLGEQIGGDRDSILFRLSLFTKKETADGWTIVKSKHRKMKK